MISHAHGDHLFDTHHGTDECICSRVTAKLAAERRSIPEFTPRSHGDITLHPAGHIAGSTATVIESDAGRILYTGDVCTRDRYYLEGFTPVDADVLIIETTYGQPEYEFSAIS